ncbi:MAG: RNA polymerase sigma factor [Phycisphaerales bacterium]
MSSTRATPAKPLNALSDEELAVQAQDGSREAFGLLFDRFSPRLFNFLLRRVGDAAIVEELTQEAFLRAWQAIDRYDSRWRFSTWLFTIGSRLASNHRRTAGRFMTNGEFNRFSGDDHRPEHIASAREERGQIWRLAEETLTEEQLAALWLRYAEDLPIAEVARVLDKTNVTVRVMLFRARQALAARMAEKNKSSERNGGRRTAAPAVDAPAGEPQWTNA